MTKATHAASHASMELVLRELRRIRRRVRLALVLESCGRLVSMVVIVGASVAAVDWLVGFPWFVRTVFLVLAACVVGIWIYRHVCRPLFSPIPLEQLALALEGLPAQTRDLLAGALGYVREGGDGSDQLWRRILDESAGLASQVKMGRLVRMRRAVSAAGAALALGLLVLVLAWFVPWVVGTGIDRLVRPLSATQWPRQRQIEPLTRDGVVAWGETYTVAMRLARGDDPSLRCFLTWQSGEEESETAMLRRDADGVYRMTLENLRKPIRYSFSAGDDDTSHSPFLLRVVKRPEVLDAHMFVYPPPYVAQQESAEESLEDHEAIVMEGSRIRLDVRPSKRISGSGLSRAEILFDDEQTIVMHPDESGELLTAEFVAEKSGSIRVVIVDTFGLDARGGPAYRLTVKPDAPPIVSITSPTSAIEATVNAVVDIRVLAQDDAGITGIDLIGGKTGEKMTPVASLLQDKGNDSVTSTRIEASYEWELSTMKLAPGDSVEYVVEVRDGFVHDGKARESVRSPVGRIQIISEARLAERLRMDLLVVRDQLRGLVGAIRQTREKTTALDAGPSAQMPLTQEQSAEATRLANEISRLTEGARIGARSLSELSRFADRNGARNLSTARQATELARRLSSHAVGALAQAAEQLSRAENSLKAEVQHESLLASIQAQSDVASSMEGMLREMEQWDEFEDMVRRLRDTLDRQEGLERDVSQIAKRTQGRLIDDLDAGLQQELLRSGVGQGQLRGETDQLMSAMQTWARQRGESDMAAAASLQDAASVGRQLGLLERMDQAAGAIQTNQLSAASSAQREAAAGLRAMLAALDERPERQLAELSRELKELSERLRRLIETQATLIAQNRSGRDRSDAVDALGELSDRQAGLQSTARQVARLIKGEKEDEKAAKDAVDGAVVDMGDASDLLSNADGVNAEKKQQGALEGLEEALSLVEAMEEQVDQERGERSLDAIVEALREVLTRQKALRTETAEIRTRKDENGEYTRADALRLNRLSRHQRELIEPLGGIKEQASASVVYSYLLEGITDMMEGATAKLVGQDADGALSDQDQIIRDLSRLIDSAKEQRDKKDPRFVQDQGGGGSGGAGQPTAQKPVPKLAELKVLKSLQADVNVQTKSMAERLPEPIMRSEQQLKQIQGIAERQMTVRELAGKMLKQAKEESR